MGYLIIFILGGLFGVMIMSLHQINISKPKMYLLDTCTTLKEQQDKVKEEVDEFLNPKNDVNQIEEFFDVIQAMLDIIKKKNLIEFIEVGLEMHNRKLKKRKWKMNNIK